MKHWIIIGLCVHNSILLYTVCLRKKQDARLLVTISANENRFSKFVHWQIPKETFYVSVIGLSTCLNCAATLPCKVRKFKIAAVYSYHKNKYVLLEALQNLTIFI